MASTDYDKHGALDMSECDYPCTGDASLSRGGYREFHAYELDAQNQPTPAPSNIVDQPTAYLGCYTDADDVTAVEADVLVDLVPWLFSSVAVRLVYFPSALTYTTESFTTKLGVQTYFVGDIVTPAYVQLSDPGGEKVSITKPGFKTDHNLFKPSLFSYPVITNAGPEEGVEVLAQYVDSDSEPYLSGAAGGQEKVRMLSYTGADGHEELHVFFTIGRFDAGAVDTVQSNVFFRRCDTTEQVSQSVDGITYVPNYEETMVTMVTIKGKWYGRNLVKVLRHVNVHDTNWLATNVPLMQQDVSDGTWEANDDLLAGLISYLDSPSSFYHGHHILIHLSRDQLREPDCVTENTDENRNVQIALMTGMWDGDNYNWRSMVTPGITGLFNENCLDSAAQNLVACYPGENTFDA
ncbi:unnamed protein product [Ectocarpus sp. CCAP 1310/34]|nr:unnamed protein product [Ectocarpus sp. CCAP 1310/34]